MKESSWAACAACLLACAVSCGGGEGPSDDTGGQGGQAGESTGGKAGGGSPSSGGDASTGGALGGMGGEGAGGQGGQGPVTCDAPEAYGGAGGAASPELEGEFTTSYGSSFDVGDGLIDQGFAKYHIVSFDNEARTIIAQNDEGNAYFPCLFSRFDWHSEQGTIYYCQSAYAAESAQAAMMTTPADSSSLEAGCGGMFPWTTLSTQ